MTTQPRRVEPIRAEWEKQLLLVGGVGTAFCIVVLRRRIFITEKRPVEFIVKRFFYSF